MIIIMIIKIIIIIIVPINTLIPYAETVLNAWQKTDRATIQTIENRAVVVTPSFTDYTRWPIVRQLQSQRRMTTSK